MTGRWLRAATLALLVTAGAAPGAAGQGGPAERPPVSGKLPGDGWAVEAVWRLEEMGLVRDFLPAERSVPITVVAAALREALAVAEAGPPARRELVRGWYDRFLAEHPGAAIDSASSVLVAHQATARAGLLDRSGVAGPGTGETPPNRTGALRRQDATHPFGESEIAVALGRHLAFQATVRWEDLDWSLPAAELSVGAGAWMLSAGRQAAGYGWAERGGLVLSGAVPLDGAELETVRPLGLPGWLRYLGPVALHTSMSRLPDGRHPGSPYFWAARVALQPHPRFDLAVHRAAMFGGDSSQVPITARTIFDMLIGDVTGGTFENQIVSVSGKLRLPTESVLPLTAYLEWGTEDAAGAWMDVPGQVAGIRVPAMPGVEALSLGAEVARFRGSCCGNPPWYRHHGFPGSWASAYAPLGHALGGEGTEISAYAALLPARGRLRVEAEAFTRDRGAENLYVPGREGRSRGVGVELAWRPATRMELFLDAGREAGPGWDETVLELGGQLFLGHAR